jgi:hypothetical protein
MDRILRCNACHSLCGNSTSTGLREITPARALLTAIAQVLIRKAYLQGVRPSSKLIRLIPPCLDPDMDIGLTPEMEGLRPVRSTHSSAWSRAERRGSPERAYGFFHMTTGRDTVVRKGSPPTLHGSATNWLVDQMALLVLRSS